jgi:hypothetical protein
MAKIKPGRGVDVLLRLAAISLENGDSARAQFERNYGILDDDLVCEQFEREVENAICCEAFEVTINYALAEAVAVLLKSRKRRRRGAPKLSRNARIIEAAAVMTARQRKKELVAGGMKAGEAEKIAAKEGSEMAARYGSINLAPTTIEDRMKRSGKK